LLLTKKDSIDTEVRIADAAIHFFTELKSGYQPVSLDYDGLKYSPVLGRLVPDLIKAMEAGNLAALFWQLQPKSTEYTKAIAKLNWFQGVVRQEDFKEVEIISSKADSANKPLVKKLWNLGFLDSVPLQPSKKQLLSAIKAAQQEFDLLSDGVLRSTSLEAFNVPVCKRMEEVKSALNTLRWLEDVKQTSPVLLLNIPSASFSVYEYGQLVLESRVIVGKKSTPTPTLSSTITEVILYPYWNVPHKIASRELLPLIKKNTGFLNLGNYQVLNKQGKVLNPYSIRWSALSAGNFPYVIRQSTGCDNALGLVKFNFYNPFTVYLHDTPNKLLFSSTRRFYSHGCMRVEKPVELAHYLLGNNGRAIDTLIKKGCVNQQSPIIVLPQKQLAVIVFYSTAWFSTDGSLRFYNDVYDKLNFKEPAKLALQ
ncbi:MAG: hypothetical protein EOO10_20155, partial [Chitinophagaceae bacterium]